MAQSNARLSSDQISQLVQGMAFLREINKEAAQGFILQVLFPPSSDDNSKKSPLPAPKATEADSQSGTTQYRPIVIDDDTVEDTEKDHFPEPRTTEADSQSGTTQYRPILINDDSVEDTEKDHFAATTEQITHLYQQFMKIDRKVYEARRK